MSAPTGASAGPAWQVRAVDPAQAERLSGLMRQCFLAAYAQASSADNVQAHLQRHYTPQRQAQELADPGLLSLVLERNAAWAGFAQLRCGGAPGEGRSRATPRWRASICCRSSTAAVWRRS